MNCNICQKNFSCNQNLSNHLKNKTCQKKRCQKCNKIFATCRNLKNHQKNYICNDFTAKADIIISDNSELQKVKTEIIQKIKENPPKHSDL